MHMLRFFIVYTALCLGAIAAAAGPAELEALREGTMKKLQFAARPETVPAASFTTPEGGEVALADFRGKYVVLNFWATWCAPCREEMPSLDTLAKDMGGDGLAVVPVASGPNPVAGIRRFFSEEGVETLPILRDPDQSLARQMGVLGLPVTVILDPEGREVARLQGGADWSGRSAKAILSKLLAGG